MALFGINTNEELTIKVAGMTCAHCSKAVESALTGLKNVKKAKVDLAAGTVKVTLKDKVDNVTLMKTIEDAGYHASI